MLAPIIRNLAILAATLTAGCGVATAKDSMTANAPPVAKATSEAPAKAAEAVSTTGEFEGSYRVGRTTCTVKPIKMAFELRCWAKVTGATRFFFDSDSADGKPKFVSQNRGKGQDRFEFDDGNYNSGRFIRADGMVLTLQRLP